jgi:hypothetical protein
MSPDFDCTEIINHSRYPIDELNNPGRQAIIEQVKSQLADDGCAVIRDFSVRLVLRPCSQKPTNVNRKPITRRASNAMPTSMRATRLYLKITHSTFLSRAPMAL